MSQPGFNIEQRMSGPPLGAPMGPPPSGRMQPPPQSGGNPFGLKQRGRSPYSKQQQNAFIMPPGHQGMRPQMPGTNNFQAQPDPIMPMPFGGMPYRGQSEPQSGNHSWPSSPGDPFPMNKSPASLPPTLQPQQQAPFNLFNPSPKVNGAFAPHEANPVQPSSSIDSMSSVFSRLALDSPGVNSGVPKPIGILRGDLQGDDPGYIDESDEVSTDDDSDDVDSASDEESSDDDVDVKESQGFRQEKTLLSQTVANPAVDSGYPFGQSQGQTSQQNVIADSFAQGNTDLSPGGFKATGHFQASQVPAGSMHDNNQMKESTLSSEPSSKFHANNDILNSFENNGPINLFEGPSAVPSTHSFNDRQVLVNQPHHDQPQFERTDSHSSASSLTSRSLGGPEPHASAFKPVLSTRKSNSDMAVSDAKMYQHGLINQFEAEKSREETGHSVHPNQNLIEPYATGDEMKMIHSSQGASMMPASYQHPEPINMDSFDNLETSQLHMSSENHHIRKDYPHTHGFGLSLALQKNGDAEKVLSPRQNQQKLTAKTELTSENQLQDKVTNSSTSSSDFSSESSSKSVLENAKYLGMKGQAQLSYPQTSESQIQSSIVGAEFDPQDQSSPAHQRYAGQNMNEQATIEKPLNSFEQASSAHYGNFQEVTRQEPQKSQQTSNTSGAQLQDPGILPMNAHSFTDGHQQEAVSGQNLVNNGNPQTMPQFIPQTHNTNQFNVADATPKFIAHSSKDHISGDQMPSEKKEHNFISKKSPGLPMPENNFGITLRDPQNSYEQSIGDLAYSSKNDRGVDHFGVEATSTQALKNSVRQMPQQPYSNEPQQPYLNESQKPYSNEPQQPYSSEPKQPYSNEPKQPYSNEPQQPFSNEPKQPYSNEPKQPYSNEPQKPYSNEPHQPYLNEPKQPYSNEPKQPYSNEPQQPFSNEPKQPYSNEPKQPYSNEPQQPYSNEPHQPYLNEPKQPYSNEPKQPYSNEPKQPYSNEPQKPYSNEPHQPYLNEPKQPYSNEPKQPYSNEPKQPFSNEPQKPYSNEPQQPYPNEPKQPYSNEPKQPYSSEPQQPYSNEPRQPSSGHSSMSDGSLKDKYLSQSGNLPTTQIHDPSLSSNRQQSYDQQPQPLQLSGSRQDGMQKEGNTNLFAQQDSRSEQQSHKLQQFEQPNMQDSFLHQNYGKQPAQLQTDQQMPFTQQSSYQDQRQQSLDRVEQLPTSQQPLNSQPGQEQALYGQPIQSTLLQKREQENKQLQSKQPVLQQQQPGHPLNSNEHQNQSKLHEQTDQSPQQHQSLSQFQHHQQRNSPQASQHQISEHRHDFPQQHSQQALPEDQQGLQLSLPPQQRDSSLQNQPQISQQESNKQQHSLTQQQLPFISHKEQNLPQQFPQQQSNQQQLTQQQQDQQRFPQPQQTPHQFAKQQQNQQQSAQQQQNQQQSAQQQQNPQQSAQQQQNPQQSAQQQQNQQQSAQQQRNPQQSAQQQQNLQQFAQQQQDQQRFPQPQQTPQQFAKQQQNQQQSAQQQQNPQQSAQQQQNPQQFAQQQQNPQQFAQQQQDQQRFPQPQQTPQQFAKQQQNQQQSAQQQQNPQQSAQQQQNPQQSAQQQQNPQQFAQQQQDQQRFPQPQQTPQQFPHQQQTLQQFAQQQQNQQHFSQEQQSPLQFNQQQQLQQQYAQQQQNLHQFPQQQQQQQQQFPQQQQNQQQPQELTFGQQQQQANQQGQQQHFPQGYGQQPPQSDANAGYQHPHYGGMSPSVTAQQMQNYGDPRYMQGWNPNAPNYGQNYNDYYNWYYNMYNNWASYGYGYGQQYPGQYPGATPWDVRSHHSSRSSYVSSRNPSEVDVDSRPSSVLEKRPADEDFEIQSLQISKKEISTFEKASPVEMERLTPLHFYKPHITARFSYFGCCVVVDPNDPNENQTASVLCVPNKNLYTTSELQEFPGPLIRGETSKKSILMFAKIKSKHWLAKTDVKRELCDSMSLLWDFMAMLIKHNGIIDGPDVAELLMQHKPATDVGHKMGNLPGLHAADDVNKMPKAVAEEQYRDYLLQGSKKEALDFAVNHDLWGHALILSYKIDPKLHHAVMSRLISSLNDEDSLVSLYGHLSGRGLPSQACHAVRSGNADWREHLAMLIANPTKNSERDKKNIIVIGDALAEQGNIGAAHLCYLLAGVKLSIHDESGSKICLLGVDHKKENSSRVDLWAKNEFIQLTEIYEFALRQSKHSFIPAFQRIKLIYINRLFEAGMLAEAFGYCESVAEAVLAEPRSYDCDFMVLFSNVCQRLFYLSMESPDDQEPEWYTRIWKLVELKESNVELSEEWSKSSEPSATSSSHQTPEHNSNATPSQEFQQEYSNETVSSSDIQPGYYPPQNQGVSQEIEGNIAADNAQSAEPQQILQAVNQTNEYDAHQGENHGQWNPNEANIPQQNESGYMQYEPPTQADYTDGQMQHPDQYPDQQPDWKQDQQGYSQQGYDQQMYNQHMYNPEATYPQYPEQSTQDFRFQGHYQDNVNEGVQEAANEASPQPYEQQPDGDGEDEEDIYDLFGKKKIKTDASNQKSEGAVDKKLDTNPKKETSKPDSGVQRKGWISSLVSKILPGRSKEAFLPDDKDKSIYWDEKEGRYVDKDEPDKPYTPPPPPPTDAQFASSFKAPASNESFASLPTPASFASPVLDRKLNASESNLPAPDTGEQRISSAPSKFSRTAHGIGKRGHRYVNSFSGIHKKDTTDAPPAASLFNPLGAPQTAPMNFFVPQVPSSTNDHAESSGNAEPRASEVAQRPQQQPPQPQQEPHSQHPQQPAFFNPTNMQQTNKNRSRFQR